MPAQHKEADDAYRAKQRESAFRMPFSRTSCNIVVPFDLSIDKSGLTLYRRFATMRTEDGGVMANGYQDTIEAVERFLSEMKQVLCSEDFSPDNDFYLLQDGRAGSTGYKNRVTMIALGYDQKDICNTLISLTERDYCETVPDFQYPSQQPLFVFSKAVDSNDLYIKVNVLNRKDRKVFVLSFHFSEYPMKKPYST